jgi:citrate lyase subunit beta/citryl-CoA lyase
MTTVVRPENPPRPRRSVLYMPAANARAMEKARELPCDALIFDLEDAVAPDLKATARQQLTTALRSGGYGHRELIVRVNALDTPWGADDLAAVAELVVDAVLLPKIETPKQVHACLQRIAATVPVWVMIETPRGVLAAEQIVTSSERLQVLVMGTSDLVTELRARHTQDRQPLLPALGHCVLVARAHDRVVLDGVHLDFRNLESFSQACGQGRDLGFDGKTLIHPSQIEIANRIFGPSAEDIDLARQIVAAWRDAQRAGKGVVVVNGRLIENLHASEAERTLVFAEALSQRV